MGTSLGGVTTITRRRQAMAKTKSARKIQTLLYSDDLEVHDTTE